MEAMADQLKRLALADMAPAPAAGLSSSHSINLACLHTSLASDVVRSTQLPACPPARLSACFPAGLRDCAHTPDQGTHPEAGLAARERTRRRREGSVAWGVD